MNLNVKMGQPMNEKIKTINDLKQEFSREIFDKSSKSFLRKNKIIPLNIKNECLYVVSTVGLSSEAIDSLRLVYSLKSVDEIKVDKKDFDEIFNFCFGSHNINYIKMGIETLDDFKQLFSRRIFNRVDRDYLKENFIIPFTIVNKCLHVVTTVDSNLSEINDLKGVCICTSIAVIKVNKKTFMEIYEFCFEVCENDQNRVSYNNQESHRPVSSSCHSPLIEHSEMSSKSKMKTCPFCAELIQADAIKCRFCGEFLNKKKLTDQVANLTKSATNVVISDIKKAEYPNNVIGAGKSITGWIFILCGGMLGASLCCLIVFCLLRVCKIITWPFLVFVLIY